MRLLSGYCCLAVCCYIVEFIGSKDERLEVILKKNNNMIIALIRFCPKERLNWLVVV